MEDNFTIAEYRYEDELKGYYIFFKEKELKILGQFLSTLSLDKSRRDLNRTIEIIDYINTNRQHEEFEIELDEKYGCDFWEDKETDVDKGLIFGQRVGDSTGYDLGKITTIYYPEHHTSLMYRKSDNLLIMINSFQPLDFPPFFITLAKMEIKLNWWSEILEEFESKKKKPKYILNYPMTKEENEIALKSIDPNYQKIE